MRALSIFLLLYGVLLNTSCKKENVTSKSCLEEKLLEYDMVKYTGQEVGCKFYLKLYEFEGREYYLYTSRCADMASIYTDCEGNQLCTGTDPQACDFFYQNRIDRGIVGISRE